MPDFRRGAWYYIQMPNYRRAFVPGGTFFFSVVTYHRRPIFAVATARELLGNSFRECLARQPFQGERPGESYQN